MTSLIGASRLPVLIIGSGLGGLTLAHALRAQRIPYRLFERDSAIDNRAQGYRISVDGGGASALRSAFAGSPGLFERYEASCAEQHPPGGRVDAVTGKVLGRGVLGVIGAGGWRMIAELAGRWLSQRWSKGFWTNAPANAVSVPQPASKSYQVDRRVLRSLLLAFQTEHITHSAELTSYTLPSDSSGVIAHFSDGSSIPGSLLVGADGVRSAVARQLIGKLAAPRDMAARIIYGKTPLRLVDDKLHPLLRKGTGFVVDPSLDGSPGLLLVQECMRFHLPDSPEDYVFWALAGKREIYEEAEKEVGSDTPSEVAMHLTSRWHPSIRLLMENQLAEQTASLRMTTSSTAGSVKWETDRRVTVLGDAIHCMPPTGGQGANAALHDAALLGLVLGKAGPEVEGGGWSKETIREYEDGMRRNVGDIVGLACIGAKRIIGATIPM